MEPLFKTNNLKTPSMLELMQLINAMDTQLSNYQIEMQYIYYLLSDSRNI